MLATYFSSNVEHPLSGVVGYGTAVSKFYESTPFFAEDWRSISEWPYRVKFDIVWPLGNPLHGKPVSVDGLRIPLRVGFQFLSFPKAQELLRDVLNRRPGSRLTYLLVRKARRGLFRGGPIFVRRFSSVSMIYAIVPSLCLILRTC